MTEAAASESSRVLGFWTRTALVVGNVIGTGIILLPASLAPYGLNALWAWLITMLGCTCLALVFSGLARTFPRDDGLYGYTKRAFGPAVTFFVLWCYWFSTWVTNSTFATGVGPVYGLARADDGASAVRFDRHGGLANDARAHRESDVAAAADHVAGNADPAAVVD